MPGASEELVHRFRAARRDRELAVLEGFHALKHALRFGAEVIAAVALEPARLEGLAADLAPDLAGRLEAIARPVDEETFAGLVPRPPRTGVVAIARRPPLDLAAIFGAGGSGHVVLLERPSNMGNLGACIRVAAAAEAAAVLSTGEHDPWDPAALRGAAGLHFALPVAAVAELPAGELPLVAVDPEGEALSPGALPSRAVLAFGSERDGLSPALLSRAQRRVAIPMRPGVSSLNLATSVAVTLFSQRL